MTRKTISDLPVDLTEEILSRIPLNHMREVRLTCKNWDTLFRSENVMKMQIAREGDESTMIAMMDHNVYLMSVAVKDVDHPSIELKGKLISCLNEQVKISKVFHCEGLLLCVLEDDIRFMVCNPFCGETRWIEPRFTHPYKNWNMFCYAIGYGYDDNKSYRRVKFLRFIDHSRIETEKQFLWYEIYNFDSGLWTTLDVTPYWFIWHCGRGVSLKGNTYWCAAELKGVTDRIICFDFTAERFGPLLYLPLKDFDCYYNIWTLSCVREEKLSALCLTYDYFGDKSFASEIEIWITTKIEAEEVSWSKFFKLEPIGPTEAPNISMSYFVKEEEKVAMSFIIGRENRFIIIGEAGYSRELDLVVPDMKDCRLCFPHVCSYVPSLLQIKKPVRGKRIKQNSLEKRRFAKKMLELFDFETSNQHRAWL